MAQKQQDLAENINRIVKKDKDEDRSLGPAAARKPIGPGRGMAYVNSTGGVSTASAGGSSSGGSGSGGSGGPGTSGDPGGSSSGLPGDADGGINYGNYAKPEDPEDPDSATDGLPGDPFNPNIPPGGTEAGSNDMTGDEAMSATGYGGGPVTGFGTGLPGTESEGKVGYWCGPNGESVKIRLGLEKMETGIQPPDYTDQDGDGVPEKPDNGFWSDGGGQKAKTAEGCKQFAAYRIGNRYEFATGIWYEVWSLRIVMLSDVQLVVQEYRIYDAPYEDSTGWSYPPGGPEPNTYDFISCDSAPGEPLCQLPYTEWPSDGVCQLQLIDGLWLPNPNDPDCAGLSPQRCYLLSNSCPSNSGTMVCVLSDTSVMLSEWENGVPKQGGITKIFSPNASGNGYTMTAATSNSQRDHYLNK